MLEKFLDKTPEVHPGAWVHPSASLIGGVKVCDQASVWPGAVLRADVARIEIGRAANVQDNAVLHPNLDRPVLINEGVTIGHSAVVHGSVVGAHCLVGMGAVVMDCEIGDHCLIAGGAVVTPGSRIPPRSMVMGAPGRVTRPLSAEECAKLEISAAEYVRLSGLYRGGR